MAGIQESIAVASEYKISLESTSLSVWGFLKWKGTCGEKVNVQRNVRKMYGSEPLRFGEFWGTWRGSARCEAWSAASPKRGAAMCRDTVDTCRHCHCPACRVWVSDRCCGWTSVTGWACKAGDAFCWDGSWRCAKGKLKEFVSAHAGNTIEIPLGLGFVWAFEHSLTLLEHFPSSNLTVIWWNDVECSVWQDLSDISKGEWAGTKARQFAPWSCTESSLAL